MCITNETKKENKAFSYLFRTHFSVHRICCGVRPLGCNVKNGSFSSSSTNCMSMDSIIEVFYRLNIMLLATKYIADNNLVYQ